MLPLYVPGTYMWLIWVVGAMYVPGTYKGERGVTYQLSTSEVDRGERLRLLRREMIMIRLLAATAVKTQWGVLSALSLFPPLTQVVSRQVISLVEALES